MCTWIIPLMLKATKVHTGAIPPPFSFYRIHMGLMSEWGKELCPYRPVKTYRGGLGEVSLSGLLVQPTKPTAKLSIPMMALKRPLGLPDNNEEEMTPFSNNQRRYWKLPCRGLPQTLQQSGASRFSKRK